ncbi:MAG TPA: hypothetical protein VN328_07900, partial [Thermodesulfovibrionales bacterium]|nr:hypothetical protein [Thermodesulfovibrionales bacterium]
MTDYKYQVAPTEIADLINCSPPPVFSLSPDYCYVAMLDPIPYITLEELSYAEVKLAGLSINTRIHAPALTGRNYQKITFSRLSDPTNRTIVVLSKGRNRILSFAWSPKGDRVAYALAHSRGVDLVTASPATGKTKRLVKERLNCIYGSSFFWSPDGSHI